MRTFKRGVATVLLMLSFLCSMLYSVTVQETASTAAYSRGYAITSQSLGLDSMLKNPAGLSGLEGFTLSLGYSSYFGSEVQGAQFGLGMPVIKDRLWAGIVLPARMVSSIPETESRNGRGVQVGTFSDVEAVMVVGAASRVFYDVILGVNANVYSHTIHDQSASGVGIDVGVLKSFSWLDVGASIQNVGGGKLKWDSGYSDDLDQRINIGIGFRPFVGITLFSDIQMTSDTVVNVGGSYELSSFLTLNAGYYDVSDVQRLSAGVSLDLYGSKFHYAYGHSTELGATHKIGIEVRL